LSLSLTPRGNRISAAATAAATLRLEAEELDVQIVLFALLWWPTLMLKRCMSYAVVGLEGQGLLQQVA
jgi:hypothetical protein